MIVRWRLAGALIFTMGSIFDSEFTSNICLLRATYVLAVRTHIFIHFYWFAGFRHKAFLVLEACVLGVYFLYAITVKQVNARIIFTFVATAVAVLFAAMVFRHMQFVSILIAPCAPSDNRFGGNCSYVFPFFIDAAFNILIFAMSGE